MLSALPDFVTPHGISAGAQLLITLPARGPSEPEVIAAAQGNSLALQGLGPHWMTQGEHPQGIMLGNGTPAEHAFPATLEALRATLAEVSP
ncbi:hypothetical protein JHE00_17120 [Prauserella sp. ASG 168]|uniref:GntR family transcriptional regulator n=1 Tax=Prauserella cavernicola TaxID=2800127 RepID=A0A934QT57_9PSEU|nr:hypothetical protein [Prauserella cavernicola]